MTSEEESYEKLNPNYCIETEGYSLHKINHGEFKNIDPLARFSHVL